MKTFAFSEQATGGAVFRDFNINDNCGRKLLQSETARSTRTSFDGVNANRDGGNRKLHSMKIMKGFCNLNRNLGAFPLNSPRLAGAFIMKSYKNLYDKIRSFGNLYLAYKKARKGKGAKWYVRDFECDLERNLLQLQDELQNMTYEPRPLKQFIIRDPKTRVISASDFRDRIVHHALCDIIEPIFEKTFIHDSYANRKGKGTHEALKRYDYFKRKTSYNGKALPKAMNRNHVYGYALKADIKHYFDSVDHEIMLRIISRKIKDEKVLWLVKKILDNHSDKKGMPIGNLTSQFFANIYLNELDYFVKHKLKAKYYIRYVDDFVILHQSKEKLEFYKAKINKFLSSIKLELHPEKSKIIPLHKGVSLLGFRVFYHHKLLKKSNIRQMKQRVDRFIELYKDGIMDKYEIFERIGGWNAYAMHSSTFKLRKRIMRKVNKSLR